MVQIAFTEMVVYLAFSSRRIQPQTQISQKFVGHGGRRFTHQIGSLGCFREGDDVAYGLLSGKNHYQAVQPQRDAAVRGSTVFQRFQ